MLCLINVDIKKMNNDIFKYCGNVDIISSNLNKVSYIKRYKITTTYAVGLELS